MTDDELLFLFQQLTDEEKDLVIMSLLNLAD